MFKKVFIHQLIEVVWELRIQVFITLYIQEKK